MKSIVRSVPAAAVLLLLASPALAANGLLIVEKTTGGGTTLTSHVQIEEHRMRVESAGGPAGPQVFIFDGTRQVMWMVDYGRKAYREITKADVQRLGQQMSGAMQQMQEQMKNLPPAQREKMQEMMKRAPGMGGAPVKTVYRKTATQTVGKWTCQGYDGYQENRKVSEVCTVPPATLGFSPADFAVSRQLADFFRALMPTNADKMFSVGEGGEGAFDGVPVRRVDHPGADQTVTELTEVSHESFPASSFEVPAGFTKESGGFGPDR